MLSRAARDAGDAARTMANLPRRLGFRHMAGKTGLASVDDPREAAVVMMLEVARAGCEVTAEHKALMVRLIREHFALSAEDAGALLTQAAWLSRQAPAPDSTMRRMAAIVREQVGSKELQDLAEMLEDVALVEGEPREEQSGLIGVYLRAVGLRLA